MLPVRLIRVTKDKAHIYHFCLIYKPKVYYPLTETLMQSLLSQRIKNKFTMYKLPGFSKV